MYNDIKAIIDDIQWAARLRDGTNCMTKKSKLKFRAMKMKFRKTKNSERKPNITASRMHIWRESRNLEFTSTRHVSQVSRDLTAIIHEFYCAVN